MQIPYGNEAIVATEKIRDYLLPPIHPIGRYKAAFFRDLGYAQANWRELERSIRTLLLKEALLLNSTECGQKFSIAGSISGPNGRVATIATVWIIFTGERAPRFVTAYPED